jgi:hypothetical protein
MDGSIAPKDQRRIGLVGGIKFVAGKDVNARQPERADLVLLRDGAQHGNGAHGGKVRTLTRNIKIVTSSQDFTSIAGANCLQ